MFFNVIRGIFYIIALTFFSSNSYSDDPHLVYDDRQGSHVAFPDVTNYCGKEIIAFREGNTHAADKGVLRLLISIDKKKESHLFSDNEYDLRNPYFYKTDTGLYLYATIFDYKKYSFIGTRIFKIFNKNCDLSISIKEKHDEKNYIIYAPFDSTTASYAYWSKDLFSNFDEKVFNISHDNQTYIRAFDEEISFVDIGKKFGIGRSHKKAGAPLLFYSIKNNKINYKNWCNSHYESALVSPKINIYNSKFIVSYSSRRITDSTDSFSSSNTLGIHLMVFDSFKNLKLCKPILSNSFYLDAEIDGGYQTFNPLKNRLYYYARGKNDAEFNIYYRDNFFPTGVIND